MKSAILDENCIFSKIIAQQLSCYKIYEDASTIAFLDINPTAKGHTLVLPKNHYSTLLDLPEHESVALVKTAQTVGNAIMQGLKADGFNLVQNNFSAAGQMVFHMHWHIIPRFTNDMLLAWPSSSYANAEQAQAIAASIQKFTITT